MANAADPTVRAAARPLVQRREASRPIVSPSPTVDAARMGASGPAWRATRRLPYVPQPRA
jgi:hypothetical protein